MYTYRCAPVRVIDGDTLVIRLDLGFHIHAQETVRLYGVNTPEIFGAKAEPAGTVAKEFVEDWLEESEPGSLIFSSLKYDARGKYGRALGLIMRENTGETLNAALIEAGKGVSV